MENKRTLKELYEIVLDRFESNIEDMGICISAQTLFYLNKISNSELNRFLYSLALNKPKWYTSKFWWSSSYTPNKSYWWERTPAGRECRIKFLKHIINKLK